MTTATSESIDGKREVVRHGSVYIAVTIVQAGAMAAVTPILTRKLGQQEYGVLSTALAVGQLLMVVLPLGLAMAVAFDVYDHGPRQRSTAALVGSTTLITVALGLVAGAGLSFLPSTPIDWPAIMRLAVLWAVVGALLTVVQSALRAAHRSIAFAIPTLVFAAAGPAVGLAVVLVLDRNTQNYLIGLAAASTVAAAIGLLMVDWRPWRLAPRAQLVPALKFGLPTIVHGAAFMVLASGDRLIIERLMGPAQTGRYQVAYTLGILAFSSLQSLNSAWGPLIHGAEVRDRWGYLVRSLPMMYQAALAMTWVGGLLAPIAIAVLAPPSFDRAQLVPVAVIVLGSSIPMVSYLAGVHVLLHVRRSATTALATFVGALINVVANFALVPVFGLVGAALATLIGYLGWAWFVRHLAGRYVDVKWNQRQEAYLYALGAAAVLAGALLPVNTPGMVVRIIGAAVYSALFVPRVVRALRSASASARPVAV
jgi:O-antigen/teichoic acid export membrane protein